MGGCGIKPFPAVFLAYSPSLWSNGNSLLSKTMLDSVNCPMKAVQDCTYKVQRGGFLGVDFCESSRQVRTNALAESVCYKIKILAVDDPLAKRTNN